MEGFLHRSGLFPVAMRGKPVSPASPKNRSTVHSEEYARHFSWVDWLLQKTGRTDASLAKEAGLASNYLYRKRAEGTVLGATQIRMLSEHYGLPGPDTYLLPGAAGLSDEAEPFVAATGNPATRKLIEAAVDGRINATAWVLKTRALEDAGFLPGDIVISDRGELPQAGDAVVASVVDLRTGAAETVFRVLEAPYLVAASADPALRKPLLIDNERVIVLGTITHSIRTRRK